MRLTHSTDPRCNVNGPFRKFYLMKQYGGLLRGAGFDTTAIRAMGCDALEAAIIKLLTAKKAA